MFELVRLLEFDAGHRLVRHRGKCQALHGHRYKVEVVFKAEELDGVGRVIDFGLVKEQIGTWLEENFDHNMILSHDDPLLLNIEIRAACKKGIPFAFPYPPSAENIARYIGEKVIPKVVDMRSELSLVEVGIWETPNCKGVWRAEA